MNKLRDLIGYPHFWSSKPPQNPNVGDVYLDLNTQNGYVLVKNYELLGGNASLKNNFWINNKVIRTICSCCGAPLPIKDRISRIVKCSYCGMELDVES